MCSLVVKVVGVVVVVVAVEIDTHKTCKDPLKVYHHVFLFLCQGCHQNVHPIYVLSIKYYYFQLILNVVVSFSEKKGNAWMIQRLVQFFSYADMCSATFIYCHSLSLLQITSSPVTLIIAFRFTCQAGCPNVVNYTM